MLNGFGDADQISNLIEKFSSEYTGKVFYNGANLLVKSEIYGLVEDAIEKFEGEIDILGLGLTVSQLLYLGLSYLVQGLYFKHLCVKTALQSIMPAFSMLLLLKIFPTKSMKLSLA